MKGRVEVLRRSLLQYQRTTFLLASGLSTAGSFAGLTAKGWILMDGSGNALILAIHFAALALPSLLVSGAAGVATDRLGSETVLVRAQWALFGAGLLGAIAIPLTHGGLQMGLLLLSTLLVGVASAYELTSRNKYCALLVDQPQQLGPYLASFSVVFNVGKLVGPPLGGGLLALTGPSTARALDAMSYLLPIATILWLVAPHRSAEQLSGEQLSGDPLSATLRLEEHAATPADASLLAAWQSCGGVLRHVLRYTALACLVIFFHPGLAPLMARRVLDSSPQALGTFTSVLAAGSICGGLILRRYSRRICTRPGLLLGVCTVVTGAAQLGMASSTAMAVGLAMTFLIGAGTACLLAGVNLITQVGAAQRIRGRMAGMGQIAFLGGGGISGLIAAGLSLSWGLEATFTVMGSLGLALGILELVRRGGLVLKPA